MEGRGEAIVLLDARTPDRGDLGGKGGSLADLVRAGIPVPPTAVLPTGAYRLALDDERLGAFIASVASAGEPTPAEEVDRMFLSVPLPGSVRDDLETVSRRLGPRIAVRSSASAEDTVEHSFAGQYRSLLDVDTDPEAVVDAVRLVWASLWHPAPWTYRRAWGIADHDAEMAVVLMAMVPAVEAGVAFTVDPGGAADAMRIETVEGLGESLVSGARTPTVWLLPRAVDQPRPPGAPEHLDEVRSLASRLEARAGRALDIEWAHDGATTWIVQSRPITTIGAGDGFDTPAGDHELTTAGLEEMLPGVLPPLRWELDSLLVEEALRATLHELGALGDPELARSRFIHRRRGRAALDLDLLKSAASVIPGGTASEIERGYFGVPSSEAVVPRRVNALRLIGRDARAARARRHALHDAAIVAEATRRVRARSSRLEAHGDGDLLAYRFRLVDLAMRAMAAELSVAAIAGGAYTRLEHMLGRQLSERDAAQWAQELTRGAGLPDPPTPGASRSVFAGPTWEETSGAPHFARVDPPDRAERRAARRTLAAELARADPNRRQRRILSGQIVDLRLQLIMRLVGDAVQDLHIRERTKSAVLELGGEVRRVHLELGRRLVDLGALERAEDIELLVTAEIVAALGGRPPAPALIGRRRRWVERWEHAGPLPERFTGDGDDDEAMPEGMRLDGRAASPGRVTAPATVVRSPSDPFPDGHVLVAAATDAGWTPLFVRAAAVVVERGGPLSHAAIVSRELGLPAVLDVHGATRRLDGWVVTVDGTQGVVVIHDDDDPSGAGVSGVGPVGDRAAP